MAGQRPLADDCYICGEPAAFAVGGTTGTVDLDGDVSVTKICYSIDTEAIVHTADDTDTEGSQ